MAIPLDISFQDVPHSKGIEEAVIQQSNRLDRASKVIARCRVSLIREQKYLSQHKTVCVRIDVMTHCHQHVRGNASSEDICFALRDAFAEVERLLDIAAESETRAPAPLSRLG